MPQKWRQKVNANIYFIYLIETKHAIENQARFLSNHALFLLVSHNQVDLGVYFIILQLSFQYAQNDE